MCPLNKLKVPKSSKDGMNKKYRNGEAVKIAGLTSSRKAKKSFCSQLCVNLVTPDAALGCSDALTGVRPNVVGYYLGLEGTSECMWACVPVDQIRNYRENAVDVLNVLKGTLSRAEKELLQIAMHEVYEVMNRDERLLPRVFLEKCVCVSRSQDWGNSQTQEWFDEWASQSQTQTQTQTQAEASIIPTASSVVVNVGSKRNQSEEVPGRLGKEEEFSSSSPSKLCKVDFSQENKTKHPEVQNCVSTAKSIASASSSVEASSGCADANLVDNNIINASKEKDAKAIADNETAAVEKDSEAALAVLEVQENGDELEDKDECDNGDGDGGRDQAAPIFITQLTGAEESEYMQEETETADEVGINAVPHVVNKSNECDIKEVNDLHCATDVSIHGITPPAKKQHDKDDCIASSSAEKADPHQNTDADERCIALKNHDPRHAEVAMSEQTRKIVDQQLGIDILDNEPEDVCVLSDDDEGLCTQVESVASVDTSDMEECDTPFTQ